jgi:chemotaxis response regulator CheB
MTVEGLTTAGSVLTMADLQSIVTEVVKKKSQQMQDNMNGMALMLKQMQEDNQAFQRQHQQNQQQLQQQQQQQFQLQQQQMQQLQV